MLKRLREKQKEVPQEMPEELKDIKKESPEEKPRLLLDMLWFTLEMSDVTREMWLFV